MHRVAIVVVACLLLPAGAGEKKPPAPSFDPKSADKTLDWVVSLQMPIRQAVIDMNGLAQKDRHEKLALELKKLWGRSVDWTMPVSQINSSGLSFFMSKKFERVNCIMAVMQVRPGPFKMESRPFEVTGDDWVLKLKPGDPVRVRGKIGLAAPAQFPPWQVEISLMNPKVSPVPKDKGGK